MCKEIFSLRPKAQKTNLNHDTSFLDDLRIKTSNVNEHGSRISGNGIVGRKVDY